MFELLKEGPYVCIHCGYPDNKDVYKIYGDQVRHHSRSPSSALWLATTSSTTSTITDNNDVHNQQKRSKLTPRLTKCQRCQRLVDEYVQLDYNILYLDAILQKISFYRHILHNCRMASNKSALKMALIFYFCEAFQRWSTSNGVTFTSERKTTPVSSSSSSSASSYFQLEVSFYYNFLCIILESSLFNLLFYCLFKMALTFVINRQNNCHYPMNKQGISSFKEMFMSLIICSYGKLFLLPCILYGGDLKPILELFIKIFYLFSLVQCSNVKSHSMLNRFYSILLVLFAYLIHMFLVANLHWLLPSKFINKLQYFLV
ncbi:sterol homeostasis protein [Dermatophagoides pteronyssinus]|uniref:Protein ARV n=2 Tax=Dermatophagoides pteronyssinus TaxID=6956 RepID=A0A6P6XXE5_DERPT|nr:protein ARV1-like [Dermatophagoides pteronyssinus]KAH9418968.1 sterol homeostasis protein [Dermatophagoides pteronyssinus]